MTRRTPLAFNAAHSAAMPSLMSHTLLTLVVATSAAVASVAHTSSAQASLRVAQSSPAPTAVKPAAVKTPYETTITADSAEVRAAASKDTGYVFGALAKGASVRVLQEEAGWVRIETTGSAFDGWVGFVKAGPGITLSADGKSIKVGTRADICAVNSERDFKPDASYRPIGFLQKGDEAAVVEQVQGDGGATYYAVQLDRRTSGWIAANACARPTAPETTNPSSSPKPDSTETVVDTTTQKTVVEVDTETGQVVKADVTTGETVVVTEGEGAGANAVDTATANSTRAAATGEASDDAAARAKIAAQVKRIRVSDLNASYKAMRAQPTEMAEFEALRDRCLAIVDDSSSTRSEIEGAKFLAKKVEMDLTIQKDLREIAERKRKLDANFKGVADLELATMARLPYDNVGRLNASKFYTGERMPLLYVLQDPGTGYTIAYLVPNDTYDLSAMLGLLVGVKGPVKYDESLRLNVINPTAVVPIMPKSGAPASATVTGTESSAPAATEK
jgi:hypothetical protein